MAKPTYFPEVALRAPHAAHIPRHPLIVRITHWTTALALLGLVVSGAAILLAHPRLYWGETGNLETPSLLDLPLPFVLTGQSGWGRSLHFLSAWICVGTGVTYGLASLASGHLVKDLVRGHTEVYQPLQRLTYLIVI